MKLVKFSLFLFLGSVLMSSCTPVEAWQRGTLAKPQMALDPAPLQSHIRSHTYISREAGASINASGGGGGCGCY
jgi:hypothetical protein